MKPIETAALPQVPNPALRNEANERTAREFEAVFIGQMTRLMMDSAEVDGPFSGGHGEEMFRGVLAEQLGTEITKRGGLGLAPAVLDQIIRLQGGAQS